MSKLYKPLNFSSQKPYDLLIPSKCPLCHCSIVPESLADCLYEDKTSRPHLSIIFYCPNCQEPFFVHFTKHPLDYHNDKFYLKAIAPQNPIKREFSPEIIEASPTFSHIYYEAAFAEACGLKEIAGIGYRKALEFLLKEYLIKRYPKDEEFIRKKFLSECIEKFITDPNLKPVAILCNRLGNDHTHFSRKYDEKDITDLKKYFNATIHWIEIDIITSDASKEV